MKNLDDRIHEVLYAVQKNGDLVGTTLFVVSDHGFWSFTHVVHPNVLLREKGMVHGEGRKITCDAWVMGEGGSALVYVNE
ncbi:alkaline phosphatase family protein [Bryocella elongata]|uniref:alkaline phosphatase family protein n=1 Tax=Bryocella elongata TaxID=863522 RepID=UPI0011B0C6EF|nr:alkaline phosphatase family protein [Bryocella elongata]